MDGGGFMQERDLSYAQISSLSSVHGSTLLNRLFAKALERQNRYGWRWFQAVAKFGLCTNLVVEKHTRMYAFQQAYGKFLLYGG